MDLPRSLSYTYLTTFIFLYTFNLHMNMVNAHKLGTNSALNQTKNLAQSGFVYLYD